MRPRPGSGSLRPLSAVGLRLAALTPDTMRLCPSTGRRRRLGSFAHVIRQCSRPGCAETAVATLTYMYARQFVWLDDLAGERDPHAYDLCDRHASRVRVPNGWRFDDRRVPVRLFARLAG